MTIKSTDQIIGNRCRIALLAFGVCAIALVLGVSMAGASKVVVSSFGEAGAQGGQFDRLAGIAVNTSGAGAAEPGDVYVLESFFGSGNNRVQRLDGDGNFIEAWGKDVDSAGGSGEGEVCTVAADCRAGTAGASEGEFDAPSGIAVDPSTGDVYVYDEGNFRVQQFTADGSFLRAWGWGVDDGSGEFQVCTSFCQAGIGGSNGGQLGGGGRIATDGAGGVYVTDYVNRRAQKFTAAGAFVRAWGWDVIAGNSGTEFEICTSTAAGACKAGSEGGGNGQFSDWTSSIAADSSGNSYVTDEKPLTGYVQKFDSSGNFASKLTTTVTPWGSGIAIDPTGNVFVGEFAFGPGEPRIEEFDASGTLVDTHIPDGTGPIALNTSEAGPFAGRIYQVNGNRVDVLEDAIPPSASLDAVGNVTATSAELSGTVQPNGEPTTYRFEHSSDGGSTWVSGTFPEPALGNGTGAGEPGGCPAGDPPLCEVSGQIDDLLPNTAYLARIVATNSAGLFTLSAALAFTTEAEAPRVGLAPTTAGQSSAALRGTVDPRGSEVTECRFEWGTSASLDSFTSCAALPGKGQGPVRVEAELNGLTPGVTYRYRLTATNQAGASTGAERQIDVGTPLPDGRAWEMVSPPDKNGGQIIVNPSRARAAQGLSPGQPMAFTFPSLQAFAGAVGTGKSAEYISIRSPEGWKTHGITPPGDSQAISTTGGAGLDALFQKELSPDLSVGVASALPTRQPLTTDSDRVSRVINLYLRDDVRTPGRGSYELVTACPRCEEQDTTLPTQDEYRPIFAGASSGFGLAVFDSTQNLTVDASGSERKAYEWERAGGKVRLAGRIPVTGDRCDDAAGPSCVPAAYSEIGQGAGARRPVTVSPDGGRVLFRAFASASGKTADYYLRLGGHATVQINASEKGEPDAPQQVELWSATPDLGRVFFTSTEELIDSDTDVCGDLYRYSLAPLGTDGLPDPSASHLTRISTSHNGQCGQALGALGVGEDGDAAYFLTGHQLLPGEPTVGTNFLYRWHTGDLTYVGKLSETASEITDNTGGSSSGDYNARVTPDGSHLLFSSRGGAGLTGYEDPAKCSGGCVHFYLYDAEADGGAGELTCVSCQPAGAPGSASRDTTGAIALEGAAGTTDHVNHPLSDDGRFAFFASATALTPTDTNGRYDVYRYDSVNGSLALLSGGEHAENSYFLDAKDDGTDAFFATAEQLSGWDVDDGYDVYDARVGGGLPEPPPVPQSCVGDACQPAPRELGLPGLSSSAFRGPGNAGEATPPGRCSAAARRSKGLGKKAERLAKSAERMSGNENRRRAAQTMRRAHRLERRARHLGKRARRCRARQRARTGTDGRAKR